MTSLRQAIFFPMAALLLLVGLITGVVTYLYEREETQVVFDAEIRQFATYIDALDPMARAEKKAAPPLGAEDLFLVQVWDSAGKLNWASGGLDDAPAPTGSGYSNIQIGTQHWRSYTLISPGRTIRASLPIDERNEQASAAAFQIAIPIAIVIPLSWLVLSFIIDRIIGRLDRIARQIRTRKPHEFGRIPDTGLPTEIKPFVGSINELIGRLQQSVEQQKRFVSDAAHELRTPLTAIGIQMDNLENTLSSKLQHQRLIPLREGVMRANLLVQQLLRLARAETALQSVATEPAALEAIFGILKSTFTPIATQHNIDLIVSPTTSEIVVDQRDAVLVLSSLIENAIAYSLPGTQVRVSANENAVTVLDQGAGIPDDKLPHIFERFYRGASSLAPGTGLGLSIAKAVCDQRGWDLRVENRPDRLGISATLLLKSALP